MIIEGVLAIGLALIAGALLAVIGIIISRKIGQAPAFLLGAGVIIVTNILIGPQFVLLMIVIFALIEYNL
jgi:hypothetical protein